MSKRNIFRYFPVLWLLIFLLEVSLVACSTNNSGTRIVIETPNGIYSAHTSIKPERGTVDPTLLVPTLSSTPTVPHQLISTTSTPIPVATEVVDIEDDTAVSLPCPINDLLVMNELNNNLPEEILFVYQTTPEHGAELLSLIQNRDILMLKTLFANNFPQHKVEFDTMPLTQVNDDQCSDISFLYGAQSSHPLLNAVLETVPISLSGDQITVENRVYQGDNLNLAVLMLHPFTPEEQMVVLTANREDSLNYSFYGYWNDVIQNSFDYVIADGEFPLEKGQIDWRENNVSEFVLGKQQEWKSRETEHYVFHFRPGSLAEVELNSIVTKQEEAYIRINNLIGWVDQPVQIYLYNSQQDKQQSVGGPLGNGFAFPEFYSTHSIYSSRQGKAIGGHEMTHVIAYHTLSPSYVPLLSEGLAVYLSNPEDSFKPEHSKVMFFLKNGDFIPLAQLTDNMSFWQLDSTISYPTAGSFVKFVIEQYGITKFTQLYRETQPDNVNEKLEEIYGLPLAELEAAWVAKVIDSQENIP